MCVTCYGAANTCKQGTCHAAESEACTQGWVHCILYVLFENAMGVVKLWAVVAGARTHVTLHTVQSTLVHAHQRAQHLQQCHKSACLCHITSGMCRPLTC